MTTKTTKANTSSAAKVVDAGKVQDVVAETSKQVTEATKAFSGLFGAFFTSGRSAIEGVIEVDKAIIGFAKEAAESYIQLGKETVQAKCLNDVIDLQAAYAHARIEASAANTREVVEMTRTKAKDAYAPIKEVIDTYRPGKAA